MFELIEKAIGTAAGLIGGETGKRISGAIDALRGEVERNPEIQKLMLREEIELRKFALADAEGIRKLLMLEVQSEDKFVRRVRPALCWIVVVVIGTFLIVIPLIQTIVVAFGREAIEITMPDIPATTGSMLLSLVGFYMGARSWDKRTRAKFGSSGNSQ